MDQSQAEQPEKANVGVDRGMDRSVKKNAKRILVGARKTGGYVALLFSGVWCLAGCSNLSGQPKALDTIYDAYEQNRVAHYKEVISRLDLSAAAASQSTRNEVMNDLILIVDQNYYRIEKSLYGHKAWADFGGSVLATGLGTAGTLSGANGVKTTLSALVTAIDSTKTSFNKDILQGQTMIAITAQMRKLRAEKMLEIRQSMKESIGDYPLSQGIKRPDELLQCGNVYCRLAKSYGGCRCRKEESRRPNQGGEVLSQLSGRRCKRSAPELLEA